VTNIFLRVFNTEILQVKNRGGKTGPTRWASPCNPPF